MRITIVYDNEALMPGVESDWGFSCVVQAHGRTILFDTGGNGSILLGNMRVLHIDPLAVEEVFISHSHFDHAGGLSEFLNVNDDVTVYAPGSLRGIRRAKNVFYVNDPLRLHQHFHSTGLLSNIEQSLVVETAKGVVVIVGCSHPGVESILKAASQYGKPRAIIGGLHGFHDFRLLTDLDRVCPTHCTQHKSEIAVLYPDKYIPGGVGRVIDI